MPSLHPFTFLMFLSLVYVVLSQSDNQSLAVVVGEWYLHGAQNVEIHKFHKHIETKISFL